MRFARVCRRPAVSTMTTSAPRALAAATASNATAAGSAPAWARGRNRRPRAPPRPQAARPPRPGTCPPRRVRHALAVVPEEVRELADARRLARAVHADDEDHRRTRGASVERRRLAEELVRSRRRAPRRGRSDPAAPRGAARARPSPRTPTSAWSSASSSRSHEPIVAGVERGRPGAAPSSARRDFDSESRRRERGPRRSVSGSGTAPASPSSSRPAPRHAARLDGPLVHANRTRRQRGTHEQERREHPRLCGDEAPVGRTGTGTDDGPVGRVVAGDVLDPAAPGSAAGTPTRGRSAAGPC